MKKKVLTIVLSMVMVFAFTVTLAGCGGGSSSGSASGSGSEEAAATDEGKTVTIKFSDYYGEAHIFRPVADKFMADVEEATKDTPNHIKFEAYPAEQLAKATDQFDTAASGTADMSSAVMSFDSGKIPLAGAIDLPHYVTSPEGTELMWKLYDESPYILEEYKQYNLFPLVRMQTKQKNLISTKEIDSLDDIKGMKVATPGGVIDQALKAYGASPTVVSSNEQYEALQKGIVNACALSLASGMNYNLQEVAKFATDGMKLGGGGVCWVINLNTWNQIDEETQGVMMDIAKDISLYGAEAWDTSEEERAKEFVDEAGGKIFTVPDSEREEWDAPLAAYDKAWVDSCKDTCGTDQAQETLDLMIKLAKDMGIE